MSFNAALEPLGDIYSCMTWSKTCCILSKQAQDAIAKVKCERKAVSQRLRAKAKKIESESQEVEPQIDDKLRV